jgi:phosphate transport system permease protein
MTDPTALGLRRRHAAERRFRLCGISAILAAVGALLILLGSMIIQGWPAFSQAHVRLDIVFAVDVIDPNGTRKAEELNEANYAVLIRRALRDVFPQVRGRRDRRALAALVSTMAPDTLRIMVLAEPELIGRTRSLWLIASDDADQAIKNNGGRRLSPKQRRWLRALADRGAVERRFNTGFFTGGDSREPEIAGIMGALVGSLLTILVTLVLSFPLGVAAAVYLEEFAPKNRWTDLIEININNLAAVPSIVFGLLGLAVFLNFAGLPRSAPLVGGMVLALMTLPTIIITGRAALVAVPPSIREGALGIGASPMQVVLHHVLPLAFPGMLTGTIIGLARALGETAPLLMIGMVAFIVDVPHGVTDPATVLPVQIFLWADAPERAFAERTAAATLVLLVVLIVMNLLAVILRKKFERKW